MMSNPTIFDKINVKFIPPLPPEIKDGKMARFSGFCAASSFIYIFFWGGVGGGEGGGG